MMQLMSCRTVFGDTMQSFWFYSTPLILLHSFICSSQIHPCYPYVDLLLIEGHSWPCSYGSWIYNYLCNQCLSPLMLWVRILMRARCTTLCDKDCRWLATVRLFSPVSSTNKTDRHDITEILLKVALNTIKKTNKQILFIYFFSSSVLLNHYSLGVKPPPSLLVLLNQLLLIYSFLCRVLQIFKIFKFLSFFFYHCIVCSSNCDFWLLVWYLQTFLDDVDHKLCLFELECNTGVRS